MQLGVEAHPLGLAFGANPVQPATCFCTVCSELKKELYN